MFGRATMTLGIGPHSGSLYKWLRMERIGIERNGARTVGLLASFGLHLASPCGHAPPSARETSSSDKLMPSTVDVGRAMERSIGCVEYMA